MTNDEAHHPRAYQRLLIDQANAEMGRRRISRRELSRITDIPRTVLDRLFQCERDMSVRQWDAIATALGFDPGELAKKARAEAGGEAMPPASDSQTPPSGDDVRGLITWLLDHSDKDGVLQTRLGDLRRQTGLSSRRLKGVEAEMVNTRRRELERALAELAPGDSPPAQAN